MWTHWKWNLDNLRRDFNRFHRKPTGGRVAASEEYSWFMLLFLRLCSSMFILYIISMSFYAYLVFTVISVCAFLDSSSVQDASRLLGSSWMRRLRSPLASSKRLSSREPGILEPAKRSKSQVASTLAQRVYSFVSLWSFCSPCGKSPQVQFGVSPEASSISIRLLQNNFSRTE